MAHTTRQTVLSRMKKGEDIGWDEFYNIYSTFIIFLTQIRGVPEDDLDDIVQQTMTNFFKRNTIIRYNKEEGKFRSFFRKIVNDTINDYYRHKSRKSNQSLSLNEDDIDIPVDSELEAEWDKEWDQHILSQALEELKNRVETKSYQAFDLYVLQKQKVKEVATLLNLKKNAIYGIKNRLQQILKEITLELE